MSFLHKTETVNAIIVSQASGVARFMDDKLIGGKSDFRSNEFSKYPDGTMVECHFRVSDGRRQLVMCKPLIASKSAKYDVILVAYDSSSKIEAIKEFRQLTDCDLRFAKDTIEGLADGKHYVHIEAVGRDEAASSISDLNRQYRRLSFELRPVDDEDEVIPASGKKVKPTEEEKFSVPQYIGDHFMFADARELLTTAKQILDTGGYFQIRVVGPSGYGKTTMFHSFADFMGYKFLRLNCAQVMDTVEWFGYQEARDGNTVFLPTEFSRLVMEGKCVILLDEANRIEPWIANSLFPIFDDDKKTNVHGEDITCGSSILFALTLNEGTKFAGTHTMDAAFLNRMDASIEVGPLPPSVETKLLVDRIGITHDQAARIVNLATALRNVVDKDLIDIDVSTRTSLKVAKLMKAGMSIKSAVSFAIINFVQSDDRKPIIDAVNTALGMRAGE